jgi:hypothetical protein
VRLFAAIVTFICLLNGHAFAWGQEGHSIIVEIAQRRLSSQAAAMLGKGHSLASVGRFPLSASWTASKLSPF